MANITKLYSDIDFTFTKKPVTNDIALSYDTQAVIRSIRNLLQTRNYERPFNPNLGSTIDSILFEPLSNVSASEIKIEIARVIKNYEPRALLQRVSVNLQPDENSYSATIVFFIQNATIPTSVTVLLERNR